VIERDRDTGATADAVLRALRKTHQVRQFRDEPVTDDALNAILDVARWSGSAANRQPWTFIVIHDPVGVGNPDSITRRRDGTRG
jgi:nitroreductase